MLSCSTQASSELLCSLHRGQSVLCPRFLCARARACLRALRACVRACVRAWVRACVPAEVFFIFPGVGCPLALACFRLDGGPENGAENECTF